MQLICLIGEEMYGNTQIRCDMCGKEVHYPHYYRCFGGRGHEMPDLEICEECMELLRDVTRMGIRKKHEA